MLIDKLTFSLGFIPSIALTDIPVSRSSRGFVLGRPFVEGFEMGGKVVLVVVAVEAVFAAVV